MRMLPSALLLLCACTSETPPPEPWMPVCPSTEAGIYFGTSAVISGDCEALPEEMFTIGGDSRPSGVLFQSGEDCIVNRTEDICTVLVELQCLLPSGEAIVDDWTIDEGSDWFGGTIDRKIFNADGSTLCAGTLSFRADRR